VTTRKPPRDVEQLKLSARAANDDRRVVVANDDGAQSIDDFFADVPSPPRSDPGRAALVAMQPPENRAALEEYFSRTDAARASGRAANASGRAGESWVEAHHQLAIDEGLATRITHVGAPWTPHIVAGRIARDRRGRVLGAVDGVAPPDYLGSLADGRHLAVEVKRRSGRLHAPLTDEEIEAKLEDLAAIERHQADYLDDVCDAALALVVVTFVRSERRVPYEVRCAVPWAVLRHRWVSPRGGRPSVGPEELEDWRARGDCYLRRFVEEP
jgi:hypothetical protein